MIKFQNVGYYKKSLYVKKPLKGFVNKLKYIIKCIFLNIKSPFNNSMIHYFNNWIIIDCNLELHEGKVYNLIGESSFKNSFMKMLLFPKKGKINGLNKYKIVEREKIDLNILEKSLFINPDALNIREYIKQKSIILIFSSTKKNSKEIDIENYQFLYNRLIKC